MIRLALAEDHPDLRDGLVRKLEFFPEVAVVATAENGAELVAALELLPEAPDVVLMDIQMPAVDGIRATAIVRERWPETEVIMLTVFDDDARVLDSLDAGANGYLLKEAPIESVVAAIRDACQGRTPLAPSVAGAVVQQIREVRRHSHARAAEADALGLTPRERDVLLLLAQGSTDAEAAHDLGLSVHTIRSHIKALFRKLEVRSRAEATRRAVELGLA